MRYDSEYLDLGRKIQSNKLTQCNPYLCQAVTSAFWALMVLLTSLQTFSVILFISHDIICAFPFPEIANFILTILQETIASWWQRCLIPDVKTIKHYCFKCAPKQVKNLKQETNREQNYERQEWVWSMCLRHHVLSKLLVVGWYLEDHGGQLVSLIRVSTFDNYMDAFSKHTALSEACLSLQDMCCWLYHKGYECATTNFYLCVISWNAHMMLTWGTQNTIPWGQVFIALLLADVC